MMGLPMLGNLFPMSKISTAPLLAPGDLTEDQSSSITSLKTCCATMVFYLRLVFLTSTSKMAVLNALIARSWTKHNQCAFVLVSLIPCGNTHGIILSMCTIALRSNASTGEPHLRHSGMNFLMFHTYVFLGVVPMSSYRGGFERTNNPLNPRL